MRSTVLPARHLYEGLKLPQLTLPFFGLANESFEPHQYWSAVIQRKLTQDLIAVADAVLPLSDQLSIQEKAGLPAARLALRELQLNMHRLGALIAEIGWGAKVFEQLAQERPLEDFCVFPRIQGELHSSPSSLGELLDQDLMRSTAPKATDFRSHFSLVPRTPLTGLAEYTRLRGQLLDQSGCGQVGENLRSASGYSTCRLSGGFEPELADSLTSLMMQHHRAPGDPEISRHGVVIARITSALLENDVQEGCQMLVCRKGESIVGVSQFFLPEAYPQFAAALAGAFPPGRNAYLLMMLVDPAEQGSVVFPMLINGSLLMMQAAGTERILGEVEHSNQRAMRAYARYGGVVHHELRFPHTSPSGIDTEFLGLSISLL